MHGWKYRRFDEWVQQQEPAAQADLKMERPVSTMLKLVLERSYVALDAHFLEGAAVDLSKVLLQQIPLLHRKHPLNRRLDDDLRAAALVECRQDA